MQMTDAERKAAERQRQKDAGLVRRDIWAHPDDWAAIRAFVARLAERRVKSGPDDWELMRECLRRADQRIVTDGKDPATGRFTKGNRFWEARSTFGRKPLFSDPEDLWKACCEYFEWVADNPLMESRPFAYQGEVTNHALPKMRAMTIGGMCIFLDMSEDTWRDYRSKPAFSGVCAAAEQVVRTQKFEGAAAGLLNHAIIARDLGMADKSEITGKDGDPLVMNDTELARWIAFKLTKAVKEDG